MLDLASLFQLEVDNHSQQDTNDDEAIVFDGLDGHPVPRQRLGPLAFHTFVVLSEASVSAHFLFISERTTSEVILRAYQIHRRHIQPWIKLLFKHRRGSELQLRFCGLQQLGVEEKEPLVFSIDKGLSTIINHLLKRLVICKILVNVDGLQNNLASCMNLPSDQYLSGVDSLLVQDGCQAFWVGASSVGVILKWH